MASKTRSSESDNLDRLVADSRRSRDQRELGYREQALKLYPWVCGRCGREFTHQTVQQLTVHHRDHNHDNNPTDGSNWELLCVYCHDNEHQRQLEAAQQGASAADDTQAPSSTHNPFADLKALLKSGE